MGEESELSTPLEIPFKVRTCPSLLVIDIRVPNINKRMGKKGKGPEKPWSRIWKVVV